jgi:hypothetical protein
VLICALSMSSGVFVLEGFDMCFVFKLWGASLIRVLICALHMSTGLLAREGVDMCSEFKFRGCLLVRVLQGDFGLDTS